MSSIAIYGAGGFGREVRGMLPPEMFAGFIDDYKPQLSLIDDSEYSDVLVAIADPQIRAQLLQIWRQKQVPFNSLISRDVFLHPSVTIGKGCIICPGVKITVDVTLGDFVILNLNSTIGHDVTFGNFCSVMPSVNISGNVRIGERVFIGSAATILQGLTIGDDAVIAAGAVVTRNVESGTTVIGVPAKLKTKKEL